MSNTVITKVISQYSEDDMLYFKWLRNRDNLATARQKQQWYHNSFYSETSKTKNYNSISSQSYWTVCLLYIIIYSSLLTQKQWL